MRVGARAHVSVYICSFALLGSCFMSHVSCHMFHVTCFMSHVSWSMEFFFMVHVSRFIVHVSLFMFHVSSFMAHASWFMAHGPCLELAEGRLQTAVKPNTQRHVHAHRCFTRSPFVCEHRYGKDRVHNALHVTDLAEDSIPECLYFFDLLQRS